MKKFAIILAASLIPAMLFAKKPLDHNSFDDWKNLKVYTPSNDGRWTAYEAQAQEGDGYLGLYNTANGKSITIPRAYNLKFSADGNWAVALIKPFFKDTRQAKIDKKEKHEMPADTLAIINLKTGAIEKIANVNSFKLGKKGGDGLAYITTDTTYIKPASLKDADTGRPLVVRKLSSNDNKVVNWVKEYSFTDDGSKIAFLLHPEKSDTIATKGVGIIDSPQGDFILLDYDKKFYGTPVWDESGHKLAYTASNDTIDESGTRRMQLFLTDVTASKPIPEEIVVNMYERVAPNLFLPHSSDPEEQARLEKERIQAIREAQGDELFINQYSTPKFSRNSKRLIIGVAPFRAANDTTIVDFEKATLDIWRWDAPFTPPQENKLVDDIRKNTYPVVIDLDTYREVLTETDLLADVHEADKWDADWVLIENPSEYQVAQQWDYSAPKKLYVKNIKDGSLKVVGNVPNQEGGISPKGKYVYWFDTDGNYHAFNIATGKTANISASVPYPLWDETNDRPMYRQSYDEVYWTADDNGLIVCDKYDLWLLDPDGVRAPICLTNGDGRKNKRTYTYRRVVEDEGFVSPGDLMILNVLDNTDKRRGIATMKYSGKATTPDVKVLDNHEYWFITRAKDADVYTYRRSNFEESPDMFVSKGTDFAKAKRVSDINPQIKDYSWGTAELVRWKSYDGNDLEGVLYLPEDFDPDKKYPMMTVFYETGADLLYHHYTPEPCWSWINYPFYVSRGYVVFQPDIKYLPGAPGECAYNCVCSGVEEVCRKYPNINKEKIGIDGQSWGGYQTAYLVTRTNMFACAGSGAPVANMTSAYGGIRWESGDSRQAQYEQGQSRIGRNLWDATDLYIANSPVFHADKVETPLLIMHNDADGAVPWYQGIELFMALRRLGKPVWMLNYNGESHNIKERRNRKDITIRLQQFFDHYLKDEPMPVWMKEGIPAVRKGQIWNTELTDTTK